MHELGPGESKLALDQDVEIYIGWLSRFIRWKYARIAKIVEKTGYDQGFSDKQTK